MNAKMIGFIIGSILSTASCIIANSPRLTIVLVVDQLAHHFFMRHAQYFKGAFQELLKNGIVYDQANFPHGMPSTAIGHVALSTGTYAHNHGIIGNYWFDETGTTKINSYRSQSKSSALFAKEGTDKSHGHSAEKLLVDGVSDQYMLASNHDNRAAYAISLKSRAAIGLGNHQGRNIWFDVEQGRMTSSRAFFDALPDWLIQFNNAHPIPPQHPISWKLMYAPSSRQYDYQYAFDDTFCSFSMSIHRRQIALTPKGTEAQREYAQPYHWFEVLPVANQYVLDCAYSCIQHELSKHDQLLVWVSVSSLDKLGHAVGCHNISLLDMLYRLDQQLHTFMNSVNRLLKRRDQVVYVLTSDHGIMPIPELLALNGYPAKRIDPRALIDELNARIEKEWNLHDLIKTYKAPQFFLDQTMLATIDPDTQKQVLTAITNYLKQTPGIRHAWTFDELNQSTYLPHAFEEYFKQQLYPGRSGIITIQSHPYVLITDYPLGTGHKTPYNYDTQVPLIIYCKHRFEKKHVASRVWAPQLATTLAAILEIPRPSAATFGILPEIPI